LAVVFAALGGILGLISAIAVDLLDRRIQTGRQAQAILGFPPLASFLEPSRDPAQVALYADQLRRLAMAVKREHENHGVRRLLVTAARDGSGSTTVLLDLARALGRLGLRVLAVEANLMGADPRYLSSPSRPGLLEILAQDLDPTLGILPADDQLPDRIGTGLGVSAGESQMQDCSHLPRLLDRLSGDYDMMLIDAAPIRVSADTEYLAGICDAVWLVVRARVAQVGEVKGSAARLERAAPAAVGLIMTGLKVFFGGGYYGKMLKEYRRGALARHKAEGSTPSA
jgi:Mrp family chromosome partitioning ATPase